MMGNPPAANDATGDCDLQRFQIVHQRLGHDVAKAVGQRSDNDSGRTPKFLRGTPCRQIIGEQDDEVAYACRQRKTEALGWALLPEQHGEAEQPDNHED